MRILWRGLLLALIQVVIVASLGAKLLYDRAHYPRVWVKATPAYHDQPIRGRYLELAVVIDAGSFPDDAFEPIPPGGQGVGARPQPERRQRRSAWLVLDRGALVAKPVPSGRSPSCLVELWRDDAGSWAQPLTPLAFFMPEHVADRSILEKDEALWVEVTVTPSGDLRPLRIGEKKDGRMTPVQE